MQALLDGVPFSGAFKSASDSMGTFWNSLICLKASENLV